MSGGTADYFRIATLVWLAWVVSWWTAALWVGRKTAAAAPASYRLEMAAVVVGFYLLFIGERLPRLWAVPGWLGGATIGLVAAGAGFAWWARIHLGRLWSGGIVAREGHRIVDTGPYAIVRHPIYTGILISAAGLALAHATPLAPLGVALIAFGFARKARLEERFLAAELGADAYAAYAGRVPMLVPFARRHS